MAFLNGVQRLKWVVYGVLTLCAVLCAQQVAAKEVVLFFTGNTQGFLEVCGCSDNQLGGVARRASVIRDLRDQYPQGILVDSGGLFAGDTALDQLRCAVHLDAMRDMAYDVAHLDVGAFRFGERFVHTVRDTSHVPFVSSNIQMNDQDIAPSFRVIERNGVRVGFVSAGSDLAEDYGKTKMMGKHGHVTLPDGLQIRDAVSAVQKAIGQMGSVDMVVLLSDLDMPLLEQVLQNVSTVNVVIDTRSSLSEKKMGQTLILGTQPQGKSVGYVVVDVVDRKLMDHRVSSAFVDETLGEDAQVKKLVDGFYERVANSAALQEISMPRFVGGDLEKQVQAGQNKYVGSETCAGCHAKELADWGVTAHAHAFQTLLQQQKHVQPDCVPCHTTGFGFETGFRIGRDHESLTNVQCEVCHGPGGEHVQRPEKRNIRRTPTADMCQQCHDADQTPDFDARFAQMLAEVSHHGQGQKKPNLETVLAESGRGKPLVELFVMADCPYGKRAETVVLPLMEQLGDRVDFRLYFIADEAGVNEATEPAVNRGQRPGCSGTPTGTGRFRSLHGDEEVNEGIRQLVIQNLYPDRVWDYILERNEAPLDWRVHARQLGMDVDQIESMTNGALGAELFARNIRRANTLGVHASPTVLVNGKEVEIYADGVAMIQALCEANPNLGLCRDLPLCRGDQDCEVPGKVGICVHPNTPQAKCEIHDPVSFRVQILNDSTCTVCETYGFVRSTTALFPGAAFETVDVSSPEGQTLQKRYELDRVPAFVLDRAFENAVRFQRFERTVKRVSDGFVPDVRMTAVSRLLSVQDRQGMDVFLDMTKLSSVTLAEHLLQWAQANALTDQLHLHFVGDEDENVMFQRAFQQNTHLAWDALLAYAWGMKQRRGDLSADVCLRQSGFEVASLRLADPQKQASDRSLMVAMGGRPEHVPFVVLDGNVVLMGAGLGRVEEIFYRLHPEHLPPDWNVGHNK